MIWLITAFGAILRFYRLTSTLQFLGDQGRDALVLKDLIVNFNYRGSQPATMFEVGILNKGKTQRSPLLFISQRANPSNNYNVTLKIPNNPNITSTDCFVFVTAIVGRTRTIFYSNQFNY